MQWINMLSWWQWSILALAPPAIIALYFLKLKRRPIEVPSTYLWRKSIEDLHVNSLWQRLRQNLLLLLQLLLLLLIFLALLRPAWRANQAAGERLIFLIDNSASMNTRDVEPTRLDEAKRRVAEMIDAMHSGQTAMIISFADTARLEQGLTDNRHQLRRALAAVGPTNRTTSLDEALRVAAGMANPGRMLDNQEARPATLYIFSDGKFADVQTFSLANLEPVYVPIGQAETPNVGIVAFSTRPRELQPDRLQAFGRLENHGGAPVKAQVELYLDDQLIDASQVFVPDEGSAGVAFDLAKVETGVLRLRIPAEDPLAVDNEAWAAINRARQASVLLVTSGNEELERALTTGQASTLAVVTVARPEILATADHRRKAAGGAYELIIYDGCQPALMPQANTLFIGQLPKAGWSADEPIVGPQIIDVNRAHPLMEHLDLGDVDIYRSLILNPPPGSTRLIESNRGILAAVGPREGFEDAVIGFGLYATDEQDEIVPNTTWPIRESFPVFALNTVTYLGGQSDTTSAGTVRPGKTIMLRSTRPVDRLTVRDPAGKTAQIERGRMNAFHYAATEQLGVYEVDEESKLSQRFTVNLFDGSESAVGARNRDAVKIGYVDVEAETSWQPARQELWKPLLLLALVVLLLEWYIYNKRVYL